MLRHVGRLLNAFILTHFVFHITAVAGGTGIRFESYGPERFYLFFIRDYYLIAEAGEGLPQLREAFRTTLGRYYRVGCPQGHSESGGDAAEFGIIVDAA
jgi:hypothetical protein